MEWKTCKVSGVDIKNSEKDFNQVNPSYFSTQSQLQHPAITKKKNKPLINAITKTLIDNAPYKKKSGYHLKSSLLVRKIKGLKTRNTWLWKLELKVFHTRKGGLWYNFNLRIRREDTKAKVFRNLEPQVIAKFQFIFLFNFF